jgi:hypothetical protein
VTLTFDLWPWKSIGFQTLLRTKYVPSLIKVHWRMLILECSQGCYAVNIWPTTHYLFHCLRYTAQRQMYINSINVPINLTTEILLLGSPKLPLNQNVELFLAVQTFIICSQQFTLGESTMFLRYKCWFKVEDCIHNLQWRICPRRLPV